MGIFLFEQIIISERKAYKLERTRVIKLYWHIVILCCVIMENVAAFKTVVAATKITAQFCDVDTFAYPQGLILSV